MSAALRESVLGLAVRVQAVMSPAAAAAPSGRSGDVGAVQKLCFCHSSLGCGTSFRAGASLPLLDSHVDSSETMKRRCSGGGPGWAAKPRHERRVTVAWAVGPRGSGGPEGVDCGRS